MQDLLRWHSFAEFESALESPGSWIAGMDFPFGQSRRFIENIGWERNWPGYVANVAALGRQAFRQALEDYKRDRPPGDKHHKRACDIRARSQSSQTLYGTPVALMFYEGAPRLLRAGVHLPHNCDGDTARVVVEAYPGVAVRGLVGNRSYKNDSKRKQTEEHFRARQDILRALAGDKAVSRYGFSVHAPADLAQDPGADDLDALICAVQAAWALSQRAARFGASRDQDRLEGWIADPALLADSAVSPKPVFR